MNLNLWILEVNTGPGVQGPTPDRVKRYYGMFENNFEISFGYLRSKYKRLISYLDRNILDKVK